MEQPNESNREKRGKRYDQRKHRTINIVILLDGGCRVNKHRGGSRMTKERINELIKSYLDVEINDGSWQLGLMAIEVGETSMTVSSRKIAIQFIFKNEKDLINCLKFIIKREWHNELGFERLKKGWN